MNITAKERAQKAGTFLFKFLDRFSSMFFLWGSVLAGSLGALGATALAGWIGVGVSGAVELFGLSTFFTGMGTFLTGTVLPFIFSVIGTIIPGAAPALSAALGSAFLVSNPIGWGIAGVLALPAVVGGIVEMGARFINTFRGDAPVWQKILKFPLAVAALPFNLLYGFCRTAYHMATGKGYVGSVYHTMKGVDIDLVGSSAAADAGGGSVLRGGVPPLIDRLVVGPVLGLFFGLAAGIVKSTSSVMESRMPNWLLVPVILTFPVWVPLSAAGTALMGAYRGLLNGSQAAVDTFEHVVGTQKTSKQRSDASFNIQTVDAKGQITEVFDKANVSTHAATLKGMEASMDQGARATWKGNTSKYTVAKRYGSYAEASYETMLKQGDMTPDQKRKQQKALKEKQKAVATALNNSPRK